MSIIHIAKMLIGILCVLLLAFFFLTLEIYLANERQKKCSKEKKCKEYDTTIHRCRSIKRVIAYILVIIIVADVICFTFGLVNNIDIPNTDNSLTEDIEVVRIDPKEILAQNTERKIKDIFNDYLFFSWFEDDGDKKESYKKKVDELFEGREPVSDASEKMLEGKQKIAYSTYRHDLDEIDALKVPVGATLEQVQLGLVRPKELKVDQYKNEYGLRKKSYTLCPTAANLQQMARTAVDVYTTMLKYKEYDDDWDEIIEYAFYGIQGYLALLFYASSGESKADCCYWIAKTFYDLATKMPNEYVEYKEHCYLMAYTFAEKGLSYKNADGQVDHHIFKLEKTRNNADEALAAITQR